jgi:hypothetical protein
VLLTSSVLRRRPSTRSSKIRLSYSALRHTRKATSFGTLNYTHVGTRSEGLHAARRFERLLKTHRRPNGARCGGADLTRASGGVVTRSYVANLRKGRIESSGYEKMRATAKAMGFRPKAWFDVNVGDGTQHEPAYEGHDTASRVEHLFEVFKNPTTGDPYTNAEVARMTLGDLSEEDVEGLRTGKISDPTVSKVAALAAAFGVPPLVPVGPGQRPLGPRRGGAQGPGRRDGGRDTQGERPPERDKIIVLGVVRQFGGRRGPLAREG